MELHALCAKPLHLLDGQGEHGTEADTTAAIAVGAHKDNGGGTHMDVATSGKENAVVPSDEPPLATNVGGCDSVISSMDPHEWDHRWRFFVSIYTTRYGEVREIANLKNSILMQGLVHGRRSVRGYTKARTKLGAMEYQNFLFSMKRIPL
ncbi:hypothetical protein B296_00033861 [Ensete ventricosum]|uniref:Uncharacterized protein n=1 Tax=Ensete ventricosum TaxID=4639 RepID=A0A426Z9T7_ENSVE|nr:hypothetical protein B296_00033861 [Ensete ventricosum]